jgi:transposase InsO family protein
MARDNPWYGYKRIAVMCRRAGQNVTNRQCFRVFAQHDLWQKKRPRQAEIYQAARLWELLPQAPNDLWQMDVTYIHIPGHGWWYAVTVIDYYSRYLLALHLTHSYSAAEVTLALDQAKAEAVRLHGPLTKRPFIVTDNGSSFLARRFVRHVAEDFTHVRIAYRTPTQLGLLERFHQTLKTEEVYWQLYDSPAHARECLALFRERYNTQRPHWALIPDNADPAADPLTPQDVYQHGLAIRLPRWQGWARQAKEHLEQITKGDAA